MDSEEFERKRTKTEKRHLAQLINELSLQDVHLSTKSKAESLVPEGWHYVDRTAPVQPKKTKITIRLDEDLAKWYRNMGHGYQGRINAVLRAYMHAAISKYVEESKDRDWRNLPIY